MACCTVQKLQPGNAGNFNALQMTAPSTDVLKFDCHQSLPQRGPKGVKCHFHGCSFRRYPGSLLFVNLQQGNACSAILARHNRGVVAVGERRLNRNYSLLVASRDDWQSVFTSISDERYYSLSWHLHLGLFHRLISRAIAAGDGDGINTPCACSRALGPQPYVMRIDDLPVGRSITIAEAVDRFVARD